jgi:peptidyl-prolyl cis-trans isomerase C
VNVKQCAPGSWFTSKRKHVKKDIVIAAVAVVIVVAVAFGLAALRPNHSASTPAAGKDDNAARALGSDNVVMRVNGDPITEREFNLFLQNAPAEGRQFYGSPAGRRALAEELVKLKVLEQEGARMGVADDPETKLQIAMAKSQITAARTLEKIATAKTEARIAQEYEKEKGNAVSLRHILFAYAGGQAPARQGQQAPPVEVAMQKASAVAAKLRGGADFAQTAREVSDDEQSGPNGGMLGPAKPDQLPPDIASVVKKLKPGQMSDPVKTQFGVHIFKVEQPSLEDLRPMLNQKVRQMVAEEEVKRLQGGAKIDMDPKFFPPAPAIPGQPAAPAATATNG